MAASTAARGERQLANDLKIFSMGGTEYRPPSWACVTRSARASDQKLFAGKCKQSIESIHHQESPLDNESSVKDFHGASGVPVHSVSSIFYGIPETARVQRSALVWAKI